MQDPNDAEFAGMPRGAIINVAVEYVLPVAEIGPKLVDLVLVAPAARGCGIALDTHRGG